ncbi:MAG: flagellar FliJ family protein [Planctomycetes bacterium]|nr:flagellar FliJ family protein [Planctomycetota bacterium]
MPRFATVHELYLREEDEARKEVGRLERRRAELVAAGEALFAERLAVAAATGPAPAERQQLLAWWSAVELRLAALGGELQTADKAIAAAREALIAAHRRTAAIAKVRELDAERERRAEDRREQRRNDDFAALRRLINA